jgi:DNA-binding NarL/FixJ family response regulator
MYQVFIVEDHPLIQAAYAEMVKTEGDMEICGMVANAEEAIDALQTTKTDIVIVDLSLPGMHGTDLIRYLRTALPGLPALMVSGHPVKHYEPLAKAVGAAGYVDKAEAAYTLIPTIRAILAPYAG